MMPDRPDDVASIGDARPGPFASLAHLYRPADPVHRAAIVEATPSWRTVRPVPDVDVVLWGRLPAGGGPTGRAIIAALRREVALTRARFGPPGGLRRGAVHRLPPPVWRPGRLRRLVRRAILGGAIVEFVRRERRRRVIDEVVAAAGATSLLTAIRPSGDGSALARLRLADGSPAELRMAPEGHRKDPLHGRAALLALEASAVDRVPRPLGVGRTAGVVWTTESVMVGRHASKLSSELLGEVIALCARFPPPPSAAGPSAVEDQLAEIGAVLPEHAPQLVELTRIAGSLADGMPRVLLHGDFWLNNLLVTDGHLAGVVDWDTWHPAGVPGVDLLTLLGAVEGARSRREFGDLVIASYWRSPAVADALRTYFGARHGEIPNARGLAAIAIGWWSARVFGSLYRRSRPTEDPSWIRTNLVDPLAWFIDLGRDLH